MTAPLALLGLVAGSLLLAPIDLHAQNLPDKVPVRSGQVQIDDGSIRTVILFEDSAEYLHYCQGRKAAFLQVPGAKANPSACWVTVSGPTPPRLISFRYTDITTGFVRQFTFPDSALRNYLYDWRTERLFPVTTAPSSSSAPTDVASLSEAQFRRRFRCPETYADEDESKLALADTLRWYEAHKQPVTAEGFLAFRISLLEEHKCEVTLRNMRNAPR